MANRGFVAVNYITQQRKKNGNGENVLYQNDTTHVQMKKRNKSIISRLFV